MQVLPALRQQGYAPQIYTLTHKGELSGFMEQAGVPVYGPWFGVILRKAHPWVRRPLLLISTVITLLTRLLWSRPDIVHCFLPTAYLVGGICALVTRIPIKVMSRRSLNRYQLNYPLLSHMECFLHRRMNAVVGNSLAVVDELAKEGVSQKSVFLIHNGIDIEVFERDVDNREMIRSSLGIPDEALVIIVVANLIPYKGHADLFQALGEIAMDMPDDWRLLCVGRDDGIGDHLMALTDSLSIEKNVMFLGQRMDIPSLLACADVGVLPSHEEGFSNAVLEGMAAGLAMIVTDVGGNGEAIENGISGLIVPPCDQKQLGQALLRLSKDVVLRKELGIAAYQRVQEQFSLTACVDRYTRLYDELSVR